MQEMTGENYQSSPYAKLLAMSEAKVGKSCFLVAGLLGQLPWQKHGGVVDKPENLHVITTDSNALGGIKRFLLETCNAPKESLNFRVYNMQQDLLTAATSEEYDYTFLNTLTEALNLIQSRVKGTPVVLASSLTGIAEGLLNGIKSPPGQNRGGGMDMAKWADFAGQVASIRNSFHCGNWHTIWEAHILKMVRKGQGGTETSEGIQIPGQAGVNFPYNVEQVARIRRTFGQKFEGSNCDVSYFDTQSTPEFISNGRNFNEALNPKERCITTMFKKLGLQCGGWGARSGTPKSPKAEKKESGE